MNEDITRRLPDQPNDMAEVIRLIQSFRSELTELKQTVEVRLHDTRPIWEKVQADLEKVKADITLLQQGQQRIEERIEALRDDTRTGLRNLKRDATFKAVPETPSSASGTELPWNGLVPEKAAFNLKKRPS